MLNCSVRACLFHDFPSTEELLHIAFFERLPVSCVRGAGFPSGMLQFLQLTSMTKIMAEQEQTAQHAYAKSLQYSDSAKKLLSPLRSCDLSKVPLVEPVQVSLCKHMLL